MSPRHTPMTEGVKYLNGEVCTESDGGEAYGSEVGLVAGDAGEGIRVLVGEPIRGQRWVREKGFEDE
ncbi:hypothetical protein VNO80_03062 [Phaseolus coccineus]|uniref:Uncharacterized protein n=1 Tax=Phaseolus coccineus TaxID=3886 RepID=A0AAN9NXZ5_PHACN